MDNKGGTNKLAHVLQSRMMATTTAHLDNVCDFGTIQTNMSLVTNLFPLPIPYGQYLICRQLTIGPTDYEFAKTTKVAVAGEEHEHKVKLPQIMCQLQPGDRVFVCWVQNDAVVVDVIN